MSEVYLGVPPSLDRCGWLEEINLPFPLRKLSSNLPHYVTLLSSISSNHFQKVTFTVGLDPFLVNSGSIKRALLDKGWQAFEDALLRLSSRSLNRLEEVVVSQLCSIRKECDKVTFLPRFREAGSVRFQFPPPENAFERLKALCQSTEVRRSGEFVGRFQC